MARHTVIAIMSDAAEVAAAPADDVEVEAMARPRFGRDMGYEQLQFFLAHQEATPALRALAPFQVALHEQPHDRNGEAWAGNGAALHSGSN